jgi:hypothetical protein
MSSIPASYVFLDSLWSLGGLAYERIGTVESENHPNLIDRYAFTLNGSEFCEIYIYPYHSENINVIPSPFKDIYPKASEKIFTIGNIGVFRYLSEIVNLILIKNNCFESPNEKWSAELKCLLHKLMSDVGYGDELEKLIMDELKALSSIPSLTKMNFIDIFKNEFHHIKLEKFTPDFIQERNKKVLSAYNSIIETINRIQAWLDNERVRKRIEINSLNSNNKNRLSLSTINECITPFCFLTLGCDAYGRYSIAYGIDSRILNMLHDDFASTLLRRIYQFTPGELEPFVGFVSLSMDCITYFENSLQDIENDNYHLIEVERHEEKSIHEAFSKLMKDDVDEETKKWFNR